MRLTAVVMNMFYTGLGIARSLGEKGVPVIGLTAQRGIYGNYTRYAKLVSCPDSRDQPEALLDLLLGMAKEFETRAVLFPTRDHDLVFLDRFRKELEAGYSLVMPDTQALGVCLDKWETYQFARRNSVPVPNSWLVESRQQLLDLVEHVQYPCIVKPVSAHHWRQEGKWNLVGGRKAICAQSRAELVAEYSLVARADERVLVQEMIPGGDECLEIAACYLDRDSNFVAGFNTRKLVQSPPLTGTGCVVELAQCPQLFEPAVKFLQAMKFTGIAEVEFKWDAVHGVHRLIEVNPRPWDQHRLGAACGADLMLLAYQEHAGVPFPAVTRKPAKKKWIAEDAFLITVFEMLWNGDRSWRTLFQRARGSKTFAIWSVKDPLPAVAYLLLRFVPALLGRASRALRAMLHQRQEKCAI